MEETVTFKPIFWRLVLWKFFPIYIGWIIGISISRAFRGYSNYYLLDVPIAGFVMLVLTGLLSIGLRESLTIKFSKDKIDGPGMGMFGSSESIDIADLNWNNLYQQSFNERISGFRTLRSKSGQRIKLDKFIYGKSAMQEIYRIIENHRLSSTKSEN